MTSHTPAAAAGRRSAPRAAAFHQVLLSLGSLRLAVLPTVTLLGISTGTLLSGAVFAEIVFSRPGIGKLVFDSAITRNYPQVMGVVLVTVAIFVTCTLISDLLVALLDPRVRKSL